MLLCARRARDIVTYLPSIRKEDLSPDMSGIRAKLQGPVEKARDFVIEHEEKRGYSGFIDLICIESLGLTERALLVLLSITMVPFFTKLLDNWNTTPQATALYAIDQGFAGLFLALT